MPPATRMCSAGFYEGLDGQPLPRDDYSRNVLEREWGIDPSIFGGVRRPDQSERNVRR